MPEKDSCSKAVCGLVAFCAVVILILLVNRNMNMSTSGYCASNNVSAARSSQMDANNVYKAGSSRKDDPRKMTGTNDFMVAPARAETKSFAQDETELKKNYVWDESNVPQDQLKMMSLPGGNGNYKNKIRKTAGTNLLSEAVYNQNNFSRSVGSKSTMLMLHELTAPNKNIRTLSRESMPSWGVSEAYMHKLSE